MRLRSLILFQICKLQCEFDRELSFVVGDFCYEPILLWISDSCYDDEDIYVQPTNCLARKKDDAYVEDKATVGLLLLVGSHKVCSG